jgi:mono/diheme cytochrome c family protein
MLKAWLLGISTLLATSSLTQAQTSVERGSYLVNGLLTCGNCHTPRGPGGVFAMDKQLSGGPQEWDRPTYKVRGANRKPASGESWGAPFPRDE